MLLAEDDADLRHLVAIMLEQNGVRVVSVSNGNEVLPTAASQRPDVILLDLRLPGLDGVGVTRALRADPTLADVPILLVSGLGSGAVMDAALEAGADGYLTKPFGPTELRERVAALLERTGR